MDNYISVHCDIYSYRNIRLLGYTYVGHRKSSCHAQNKIHFKCFYYQLTLKTKVSIDYVLNINVSYSKKFGRKKVCELQPTFLPIFMMKHVIMQSLCLKQGT